MVTLAGFLPTRLSSLQAGDGARRSEPLRVVLRRWRKGFGYVLDLNGQPVTGAEVRLWSIARREPGVRSDLGGTGGSATFVSLTDPAGRFEIEELKPGRFDVRATADGFAPLAIENLAVVFDGDSGEVDLGTVILEPGVRVRGQVLDVSDRPIPGVKISYEPWSSAGRLRPWGGAPDTVFVAALVAGSSGSSPVMAGRFLVTNDGYARLASLPAGTWDLLVRSTASGTVKLRVSAPGESVAVALPRGTRLEVSVSELVGGTDIATVTVVGEDGPFYSVEAGGLRRDFRASGGWTAVEGLPPGAWRVSATSSAGDSWSGRVRSNADGGSVRLVLE